jgi:signal transduction histidine kinase
MHDASSPHRTVPDGELVFGRLVAGTTHELTNVLNIISELAGLQEDILRDVSGGDTADAARLAQLADRIRQQTDRGQALLRQLNTFAHSTDHADEAYDVGDMLESLVALCERFARLRRTQLELRPPLETITVTGDPFAMLVAVFTCVETALAAADTTRRVRLLPSREADGVWITVESGDPLPTPPPEMVATVERALAGCAGRILQAPSSADPHLFVLELKDAGTRNAGITEDTHAP